MRAPSIGDRDPDDASGTREQDALDQELADQDFARSAQGGANRSLGSARCAPRRAQIGDVGTGDKQTRARKCQSAYQGHLRLPAGCSESLHLRDEDYVLLGDFLLASPIGIGGLGRQPLT